MRHRSSLSVTLAALSLGCGHRAPLWSVPTASPRTERTVAQGKLVGGEGRYGSDAWLGIPFAAPPVGELRWRAPRPAPAWSGVRQALKFGPACPQYASKLAGSDAKRGTVIGDEDCLTLDVWSPRFEAGQVPSLGKRLPVLFWIHGGGNSIGMAGFFDGGHLASDGAIVVTTQYRLGPFGWFYNRALRSGEVNAGLTAEEASGNFGTLDLMASLHWVHDNIAAFGGDPDDVTVFGESAGGLDVFSLLLAPQAKGLFRYAIVESGGFSTVTPAEAERFTDEIPAGLMGSSGEAMVRLLRQDGLAVDRAAAKAKLAAMTDSQLAAYLRQESPAQMLAAYESDPTTGMMRLPLVFDDGVVLPAAPWTDRFARPDGWNQVPVVLGTNRDETKLFLFLDPTRIWKLFDLFPRFSDEPTYLATAEWESRAWKLTGADGPAAAMRRSGQQNVYVYRFDWHDEPTYYGSDLSLMLGAAHGFEIPFVFGHFYLGAEAERLFDAERLAKAQKLSDGMRSYWLEFAATGSPGKGRAGEMPTWPVWGRDNPNVPSTLLIDLPNAGGTRVSDDGDNRTELLVGVASDPRLPAAIDRCAVYRNYAGWVHLISREEYSQVEHGLCADYPLDSYKWKRK
jgi:para-nitrobenzyl esterase